MNKKVFEIRKFEDKYGGYMLVSDSGDVALFFTVDDIFLGTLFDANNSQIKDIALFEDWDANHPNSYLCNKYNIDPEDDIFGGVMCWEDFMEVLADIGVIGEEQIVDSKLSLEAAIAELFY